MGCEMKAFSLPKTDVKNKLRISFSGGRSSAYMAKMIKDWFSKNRPDTNLLFLFSNTGQEHPKTLEFVDRCDKEFGLGVVWIEAEINARGIGTSARVVDFKTASRDGRPFEDFIKKHGIPNKSYPQCTTRLKTEPMDWYCKSIGWKKGEYSVAVGIRYDEWGRMSTNAMKNDGVFYPLIESEVTKKEVVSWWSRQSFDLEIPEHYGNCVWCWKKSLRKLLTVAREIPGAFDFPARMEREHSISEGRRRDGTPNKPRLFFRENRSSLDLIQMSNSEFKPFSEDNMPLFSESLDVTEGGCGSGECDIYTEE